MFPHGENSRTHYASEQSIQRSVKRGKDVAEPKFRVGDMVRVHLCSWEAEDLIVQGPIIHCKPRVDAEKYPEDHFAYQVKDEPFVIRESLLMAL